MTLFQKKPYILKDDIFIHKSEIYDYYKNQIEKLSEIFLFKNKSIKAPRIKWRIGKHAPTHAFLYVLNLFEKDFSNFCEEILKFYFFYENKIPFIFTNNLFFSLKSNSSEMFEFKEICMELDQEEHLYILKKYKSNVSKDLYAALRFPSYLNEFLQLKRSHVNFNTSILYEVINNLLIKFPRNINKEIFTDLQHFLIFAVDSFSKQHSLKYIVKIILAYYFFKKELEHKLKAYKNQRLIKIKISKTKLYFPLGHKDVLGAFIALNVEIDTERFGKKHIVMILKESFSDYSLIENSFFAFQIGSLNFLYFELKQKKNIEFRNLKDIAKTLTFEIKNSIETISSKVISYRNEEEIYRNIILLKDQLQSKNDLPQVIISFYEHSGEDLKFHAIILQVVHKEKPKLKTKAFNSFSETSIYIEKTISLEPLDDVYTKKATIIRFSFPSSKFIRKDHSIDLLKARNFVNRCITELIGEFRDFNGGYIDQQRKNFYQLKQELGTLDHQNEIYIESLFYSLSPVTVQTSLPPKYLRKLFLFFLKITSLEIPLEKNVLTLIEHNDLGVYFFIKTKEIGLKKAFLPTINECFFDPLKFASTSIEIDNHLYLGFILLHSKNPNSFINKVNKIINDYLYSKKTEQSLYINLPRSEYYLDPSADSDRHSGVLIKMLYEGLTRIGIDNKPQLAIADAIKISEDKKTYIFHLKNSYWSNKAPVTAYDFEYAWKKILDPNFYTNYAFMFYGIKNAEAIKTSNKNLNELGVKSIDEKTLKVDLEHPMPYFLSLLAHWCYSPLCKKVCQSDPGWAYFGENEYICNGPFKIDTWECDKEITLVKNSNYWDANAVKLNQIKAFNIEDEDILLSLFNKGKIHWLGEPLSLISSKILNSPEHRTIVKSHKTSALFWLMLNVKSYPIGSKLIRQALAYSLNRKVIVENILGNKASIATHISKNFEFFSNENAFQDADYEKAKKCFKLGLKELGLNEKTYPPITLTFCPSEQYEKLFLEVAKQWKDILGISVILKRVSILQLRNHLKNNDFQISGYTHYSWSDDPIYHFDLLKRPSYGFNGTQWKNSLFLSLIKKAQKELNPKKREKIIIQAEQIVLNDMPIIPIYFYNYRFVHSKSLKNTILSNVGQIDFKYSELK